jgi:ribose transport system substrate-binding protein
MSKKMQVRIVGIGLTMLLLALAVAACGESSSDSTQGGEGKITAKQFEEADALVKEATAPISKFPGPTEPAPAAKGKFVVSIPCSLAAAGCKRMDEGVKAAAKAIGWKELTIDPQSDTNKTVQAIEQAIRIHADAIFLGSIDPKSYQAQVNDARKAGVVVITLANSYLDPTTGNVSYDVSIRPELQAKMMGGWLTQQYKGKANLAMFTDEENPILRGREKGSDEYLESCPACYSVEVKQPFTIASLETTLPTSVKGTLTSHPDVNVAWIAFDGAAAAGIPAMEQAGLAEKVKAVSFDGDAENVQWIAEGHINEATIAVPLEWVGWAGVDEANRAFDGKEFAEENIPLRLIDEENAAKYESAGFTGDYDYEGAFEGLWGVG